MRVTLISDDWRRNGGLASYARRLAAALSARGDDVQVVHNDEHAEPVEGVRADLVRGAPTYAHAVNSDHAAARAALEVVGDFQPDVVHVHNCSNFAFESGVRDAFPTTKTLHVFDFCPTATKYHHRLEQPCHHATSALCLPRIAWKRCAMTRRPNVWVAMVRRAAAANRHNARYSRLIVASEYVRQKALETGYEAEQVDVIPYFVSVAAPPPPSPEPGLIVTAGRLVREKGFDLFLQALTHLSSPFRAVIAGEGMERAALERQARALNLSAHVTFAGWQDEAGMNALYHRASVVVMPSRWPEPSGLVGMEAMACGRPVVAFRVGGIPEWLDAGNTGMLVEPNAPHALASAMAALLDNPAAAARMGAAGRRQAAARFSAAEHLARLDAVYTATRSERE